MRITKVVLSRTQQKVDGHGVKLLVLLIPTKELVYADLMQREGRLTGAYARLVEMENRARKEIASWCAEKRIACIDALPVLRNALAQRQQIYPSTTESHPNAAGYGLRAATVNEALNNGDSLNRKSSLVREITPWAACLTHIFCEVRLMPFHKKSQTDKHKAIKRAS